MTFSREKKQEKVEVVMDKRKYLVLLKMTGGGGVTGVVVEAETFAEAAALADEIGPTMGTDYVAPLAVAPSYTDNGVLRFADLWTVEEMPPPPRKREFRVDSLWRP